MCWINGNILYCEPPELTHDIPAWSLHRLLELNLLCCDQHFAFQFHITDIDDAYEFLVGHTEWLIKEGYFNKEYLVNQAEVDEHCKGVLEYLNYIREED